LIWKFLCILYISSCAPKKYVWERVTITEIQF
jgi:hypothetical protein